jgi:hypothetical protein
MQRPALFAVALLLAACAARPGGPTSPIALEQVGDAPALEASAARRAVVEFVSAYAASPTEGVGALAQTVAGRELASWVRWLDVQHREFAGSIEAAADVRDVEFVGAIEEDETRVAQVALSASVVFAFDPDNDDAFERARILDGAVALVRSDVATYKVFDVQRDGVRMSEGIQLFREEVRSESDVEVVLDSLFMFPPNWQFNVVIRNATPEPLFLDEDVVGLYVEEGDGFERIEPALTGSVIVIPPAAEVEGILAFPVQPTASGRVLTLGYRVGRGGAGNDLVFDFPLEEIVTAVPPPPPTEEETVEDVTT